MPASGRCAAPLILLVGGTEIRLAHRRQPLPCWLDFDGGSFDSHTVSLIQGTAFHVDQIIRLPQGVERFRWGEVNDERPVALHETNDIRESPAALAVSEHQTIVGFLDHRLILRAVIIEVSAGWISRWNRSRRPVSDIVSAIAFCAEDDHMPVANFIEILLHCHERVSSEPDQPASQMDTPVPGIAPMNGRTFSEASPDNACLLSGPA